jgi:hypothetical protein
MAGKVVPLRNDEMLLGALALLNQGAAVIPLWWPEGERCACGDPVCKSAGKHPIGKLVPHGAKDASKDSATVKRWWAAYPKANIGLVTGRLSGIVVVDVDGPKGQAKHAVLLAENAQILEARNYVETGRIDGGQHYYFKYPANAHVPNHKDEGLEIKSDAGYVVAPPSKHASGKRYAWKDIGPLEELPKCFVDFAVQRRKLEAPAHSQPQGQITRRRLIGASTAIYSPPAYSEAEVARIRSTLAVIPADDRNNYWLRIGAALHWTGWGDPARALFDEYSKKSTKYDPAQQDKLWKSFARGYDGISVTLGTLFDLAKQHGWEEPAPDEIAELNNKHFLIRNVGGKCLVGEMVSNPVGSGQILSLQSVESFKTWYTNRRIRVRDSAGNIKWKPLGAAWLEHPKRRQYEGVDLVPNAPKELPNGHFNLWRGFGVEPKKGDCRLMVRHVCHVLANGDKNAAEYILRWTAWSVQHPGELAEVALVFRGGKGSGKGVFGNAVAKCFGEHALHIFHQNHLTGNFNGHLRSCLFLFADEAFWAGDKKGESVLKGLITERTLVIEQKGIDAIQWPNRLHVLMAANSEWVVPASHDERRFAVFDVSNRYAQGACADEERRAYFDALHREIKNGGLEATLYDLLYWDLGNWHPRQVYETEGLRHQKEQSLPLIEQWYVELLEDGKLPGAVSRKDFACTRALVEDAKMRVPRLNGYLSDKGMGDFLRKQGCTAGKERGTFEQRGWRFPPLNQLRAEWSRRYSGWQWRYPEHEEWQ